MMRMSEWKEAVALCAVGAAVILPSGCATTTGVGTDAGCRSYAEARLAMPDPATVPHDAWGHWIADTDDRMTGTCR